MKFRPCFSAFTAADRSVSLFLRHPVQAGTGASDSLPARRQAAPGSPLRSSVVWRGLFVRFPGLQRTGTDSGCLNQKGSQRPVESRRGRAGVLGIQEPLKQGLPPCSLPFCEPLTTDQPPAPPAEKHGHRQCLRFISHPPKRDCPPTWSRLKPENPWEGVYHQPGPGARPHFSGIGCPVAPSVGGAMPGEGAGKVVSGVHSMDSRA